MTTDKVIAAARLPRASGDRPMTAQHTPGPWHINTAGSARRGEPFKITEFFVYAPDTQDDTAICADVIDPVTQEPSEANARLIAAAPDLLAALQVMLRDYAAVHGIGDVEMQPAIYQANAAIQKATNKEQA